jgi:hypothetical protein
MLPLRLFPLLMLPFPFLACSPAAPQAVAAPTEPREYAERTVDFSRRDGPYTAEQIAADFGNGNPPPHRAFAAIKNQRLHVTFTKGHKVNNTGLSLGVRVPDRPVYEISFKLKYPESFEADMHGKMIGISGGRGYDGGRGDEARENGDGWSIRMQFDSRLNDIRKTLYVYHSQMTGKYGGPHGAGGFAVQRGKWHQYRLRVTMQSAADQADGRIEVWLDGKPQFDVQNVQFVTQESGRNINRVRLELFPGGAGHTPTRDHIIEIDDFAWKGMAR